MATGTHPRSLYRLLRALAGLGIFAAQADGRFALSPLAEPLCTGAPGFLRATAQYVAVEMHAWNELLYSVQTGVRPGSERSVAGTTRTSPTTWRRTRTSTRP